MNTHDDIDPQVVMGAYFDALLHEPAAASGIHASVDAVPAPCVAGTEPAANDVAATPVLPGSPAAPVRYQLIKVCGLTLGIPAQAVAAVVSAAVSRTPANASWALGVYQGEQGEVTVVDTGAVVTPDRPRAAGAPYGHLVVLNGQPWALACDAVETLLTPDPGSVHWRGAQGKRPWLAGTVSAPPCALLDMAGLARLLEGVKEPHSPAG